MWKQVIYEGHEFHNHLWKDLKVYKNSAIPQNIVNPKVFCPSANQALECTAKANSNFPVLNNFIYTVRWDHLPTATPVLWKILTLFHFTQPFVHQYKINTEWVYTWLALIYIWFVVTKKPQQNNEENSPQLLKDAVVIHLESYGGNILCRDQLRVWSACKSACCWTMGHKTPRKHNKHIWTISLLLV